MTRSLHRRILTVGAAGLAIMMTGCTRDGKFQAYSMWNESRLKPMESSPQPGRASSARELVPGTVARGQLRADPVTYTGRDEFGELSTRIPFEVTHEVLLRGQERFNIHCAPCHSYNGDGDGLIVKRGFTRPPDYAIQRLRDAPVGHFYDVITHGYGVMYSYASRVPVNDRWAIAAYIRAIQASRPVVPDTRPEINRPAGTPPRRLTPSQRGITPQEPATGVAPAPGASPRVPSPLQPGPNGGAPEDVEGFPMPVPNGAGNGAGGMAPNGALNGTPPFNGAAPGAPGNGAPAGP